MPIRDDATVTPLGDRALRIGLGEQPDAATVARVQALARWLREQPLSGQCDVVPAYTTVTLHYRPEALLDDTDPDDLRAPWERLAAQVRGLVRRARRGATGVSREVVVPICYGGEAGPDLAAVAYHCGLSEAEVIARHLASPHQVCMLGFAPGFPFITGLDPALRTARRATPRTRIPPGSVAIAREQTCIYPLETPGGWNLIGRTPLRLFDPAATPPSRLRAGDRIRFEAIDAARFEALQAETEAAPAPRRRRSAA
jgi:inhibitor of KinA